MQTHELRSGGSLGFDGSRHQGMHIVLGAGNGARLEIPDGWLSVWWLASGSFTCITPDCTWNMRGGELMSWCDTGIVVQAGDGSAYQAICGHASAWAEVTSSHARLLPWRGAMDIASGAAMLELARTVHFSGAGPSIGMRVKLKMALVVEGILRLQQGIYSSLPLCPGRSRAQKLGSLKRLMRIRNVVESDTSGKVQLRDLSAIARCSPRYLLRIYKNVFGETALENMRRTRLERAFSLIRESSMPIGEVSEHLGYESQSAFSRSFKARFGMAPGKARSLQPQGE